MDMETLRIMRKLTVDEKNSCYVKHALEVRRSLASGNYGRFLKQNKGLQLDRKLTLIA